MAKMTEGRHVDLEQDYRARIPRLDRFREVFVRELHEILAHEAIELSVPIQHRTKTWLSITEKINRKTLVFESVAELRDLVGVRVILQFRRDIELVCSVIERHFVVTEREDARERLNEDQFGYASIHFIVKPPSTWAGVPTTSDLHDLAAEVQVRTTAQHIWASASHVLQYKHEQSVPMELRRGVSRIAALLETVDLEFERLLSDRERYVNDLRQEPVAGSTPINVDVLRQLLDEKLPNENKIGNEEYADLVTDLLVMGASTVDNVRTIIERHLAAAREWDRKLAFAISKQTGPFFASRPGLRVVPTEFGEIHVTDPARPERGIFFDHVGLVRLMLGYAFGSRWESYNASRSEERRVKRLNAALRPELINSTD
jgi:putative GTP pyrophosphokinase